VVRAWDVGSDPMALWVKCLNVLNTCREWDQQAKYLNDVVRDLTITHLETRLTARYRWCMVSLGASRGMPDSLYQRL
jgi:hypothetical protein